MEIITDIKRLHEVSIETTLQEVNSLELIKKLQDATQTAWIKGYGLSAIQIDIPLRFAWFYFQGKDYYLLNPKIITGWAENTHKGEGCLSLPNIQRDVKRYYEIEYINGGKIKKAKGILAIIVQHEIDHMDGILIID